MAGEPADSVAGPRRSRRGLARFVWIAGAAVVAFAVAFEWAEFQQEPLLERPSVQSLLIRLGIREPEPEPIFRELEQIILVSRELKSHPVREDTLRLTATIVNRAARIQALSRISKSILLDAAAPKSAAPCSAAPITWPRTHRTVRHDTASLSAHWCWILPTRAGGGRIRVEFPVRNLT